MRSTFGDQAPTDASCTGAGVDDQGQDPDGRIVVLEPRNHVKRDEPDDDPVRVSDDDLRIVGPETR